MVFKTVNKIIFFYFISLLFVSCYEENDKEPDTPNYPLVPTIKDVTYLIYMVGQNDLSSLLNENIDDLMKGYAKSDANANVLVYADISSKPELYLLKKENGNVIKKTIKTYPNQYSVDPLIMKKVIKEVMEKYPAEKFAVTFSSHADGSLYRDQVIQKRSFGYEGDNGYGMNITDIRIALQNLPKFELIMFDACMMSSVETAYEFKDLTHYMLASPNSVPGEGFPYDKILPSLLKMNVTDIIDVAKAYMNHFSTNNVEWDNFASICVADVTKMDSLALYMDSLFQDEIVCKRSETINRTKLQNFEPMYPLYDYGHWLDNIGKENKYLNKTKSALEKVVIYKNHGGYSTVNDYTEELVNPIKDETFCGFNTYVHSTTRYNELAYKSFFTQLKWYKEAGFWRCPYYCWYE